MARGVMRDDFSVIWKRFERIFAVIFSAFGDLLGVLLVTFQRIGTVFCFCENSEDWFKFGWGFMCYRYAHMYNLCCVVDVFDCLWMSLGMYEFGNQSYDMLLYFYVLIYIPHCFCVFVAIYL